MTQAVLAKAVGIDQSTLSDIERGADFSAEILMRLAEQVGSSCEYIMRGIGVPSENLRRAQQAVRSLSDEERVALFAAIQQPGLVDNEVEARVPITKIKPATTAEEIISRHRVPAPPAKKPARKHA